jgi:hypothetical protein
MDLGFSGNNLSALGAKQMLMIIKLDLIGAVTAAGASNRINGFVDGIVIDGERLSQPADGRPAQ